jgi:uncharacterized protein HemY
MPILLTIVVSLFLVATIALAVLYLMEWNKTSYNQTEQGMYSWSVSKENNQTETFDVTSDFNGQQ